MKSMHGMHYDVAFHPDGSVMERRWSEDNEDGTSTEISCKLNISSLEFVQNSFLLVAKMGNGGSQVLWMDGDSTDAPSVNYWDFELNPEDGVVMCTSARFINDTLCIAFGTDRGKLGILETSASGKAVKFVEHVLEQEDDMPLWQVSHLNWFDPTSLAIGFNRVIIEEDPICDDEDEDDPNEHQANLLVGNLTNGSPLDSTSWTWSDLGDVVPFFSIPKGGHHVFHTAALPILSNREIHRLRL